MICPPCKAAGAALRSTALTATIIEPEALVRQLHEQCEAGPTWDGRPSTCPCRHEIAPESAVVKKAS